MNGIGSLENGRPLYDGTELDIMFGQSPVSLAEGIEKQREELAKLRKKLVNLTPAEPVRHELTK